MLNLLFFNIQTHTQTIKLIVKLNKSKINGKTQKKKVNGKNAVDEMLALKSFFSCRVKM